MISLSLCSKRLGTEVLSSQIAFRWGIIDAWNLSGFDVTVKLLVFNMYVLNVESKLLLSSKTFVTIVAR